MTDDQIVQVLNGYLTKLREKGVTPLRHPSAGVLPSGMDSLRHAAWMCQEVIAMINAKNPLLGSKAMRWVGFIQGILWMTGQASIEMMKSDNR